MKTDERKDDLWPEYRLEDLGPIERGKHFAAYKKDVQRVLPKNTRRPAEPR